MDAMRNDALMDLLSLLSVILQLQVMEEQKQQANNDDIMHELQKQNEAYLEEIIRKLDNLAEKLT